MIFKKITPLLAAVGATSWLSSAHAAPTITTATASTLQSAIKAQKGKVVVVNFWATWCLPCIEELPAFAKLQKQYAQRGVAVILVSADDPSAKAKVAKTLIKAGHQKTLLIKGDMVAFFEKYDPAFKDAVALPRTYIYNRKGAKVKAIENDHTAAQYAKFIQPYL